MPSGKLLKNHSDYTNSEYASNLLYSFDPKDYFKVLPNDYAVIMNYIEEFRRRGENKVNSYRMDQHCF